MAKSSTLILVRHAAVQIDPSVTSHEWQLTEDGRTDTHRLAQKLRPYQPARIFTSTEAKAIATGAALAEALRLPSQAVAGLQEHDRRGVPYFENKAEFETAVSQFFTHPQELVLGNETAVQAYNRFAQAVLSLCQSHPDETLILTTHGTVLTLFVQKHNPQLDILTFWHSLKMPEAIVLSRSQFTLLERLTVDS